MVPTIKNVNYIKELDELNFDKKDYTIIGSGILAASGIRNNDDIDIVVKKDIFRKLEGDKRFTRSGEYSYDYKHISIYRSNWPCPKQAEQIIKESKKINGYNFITLDMLMAWKILSGRPKDKRDIRLIRKIIEKNNINNT